MAVGSGPWACVAPFLTGSGVFDPGESGQSGFSFWQIHVGSDQGNQVSQRRNHVSLAALQLREPVLNKHELESPETYRYVVPARIQSV